MKPEVLLEKDFAEVCCLYGHVLTQAGNNGHAARKLRASGES